MSRTGTRPNACSLNCAACGDDPEAGIRAFQKRFEDRRPVTFDRDNDDPGALYVDDLAERTDVSHHRCFDVGVESAPLADKSQELEGRSLYELQLAGDVLTGSARADESGFGAVGLSGGRSTPRPEPEPGRWPHRGAAAPGSTCGALRQADTAETLTRPRMTPRVTATGAPRCEQFGGVGSEPGLNAHQPIAAKSSDRTTRLPLATCVVANAAPNTISARPGEDWRMPRSARSSRLAAS